MVPRSFRSRLTAFFVVIVLLPMVAVSVILFRLVADAEQGKSDARLAQAQRTALGVFDELGRQAAAVGGDIARSPRLARAIESGDGARIDGELRALIRRERAASALLVLPGGERHAVGAEDGVAGARTRLVGRDGGRAGTLQVAIRSRGSFAQLLSTLTDLDAVVSGGGAPVRTTLPGTRAVALPRRGAVEVAGERFRVTSFDAAAVSGGPPLTVRLLSDERSTRSAITKDSVIVAALLLAFLVLAFAFALTVSRTLQAPVERLLSAARRLGGGDFDVMVPTEGGDELAALGTEFNAMARQLEQRLEELDEERRRLQHAIRRVGELSASGLDRDAVLEIIVQTAVDGVGASVGRASARSTTDGALSEVARVGEVGVLGNVLEATDAAALEARKPVGLRRGDWYSLAQPLHPADSPATVLGLITVAREAKPFTGGERDLFQYLASQASVSIENVDLHRAVQRQAVTDELTGLFNHRRFQEVMAIEVERSKRFEQALGLIMLDIDDFKLVNDRYGHLQGDEVLREVARVLIDSSREIDEPARYGGEEMAVALPQTDLDGAQQFAERLRARIEGLEIPLVAGKGALKITASFGAAALPESAIMNKDALVAAADSALYRAKRLGKNRVVKAG